jgi:hypothetical protein
MDVDGDNRGGNEGEDRDDCDEGGEDEGDGNGVIVSSNIKSSSINGYILFIGSRCICGKDK